MIPSLSTTGDSSKRLQYGFRVAYNIICLLIAEISSAIVDAYHEEVIVTPTTPENWMVIVNNNSRRWQYHHCIGAIDGIIQFNSIFYFSELYNSEKHIHVIQYLNNRLYIITKTSLDYTIRWDSKTALLVVVGLPGWPLLVSLWSLLGSLAGRCWSPSGRCWSPSGRCRSPSGHCWAPSACGKHVAIRKSKNAGSYYFNYKNFHFIILMALVDGDYKYTWVEVSANGTSSDAQIFSLIVGSGRY